MAESASGTSIVARSDRNRALAGRPIGSTAWTISAYGPRLNQSVARSLLARCTVIAPAGLRGSPDLAARAAGGRPYDPRLPRPGRDYFFAEDSLWLYDLANRGWSPTLTSPRVRRSGRPPLCCSETTRLLRSC